MKILTSAQIQELDDYTCLLYTSNFLDALNSWQLVKELKAAKMCIRDRYKQLGEKFPANIDFANFMRARVNSNLDPETKQGLAKPFYEALAKSLSEKACLLYTSHLLMREMK